MLTWKNLHVLAFYLLLEINHHQQNLTFIDKRSYFKKNQCQSENEFLQNSNN